MRTDGRTNERTNEQTDRHDQNVALRNFANAPKKDSFDEAGERREASEVTRRYRKSAIPRQSHFVHRRQASRLTAGFSKSSVLKMICMVLVTLQGKISLPTYYHQRTGNRYSTPLQLIIGRDGEQLRDHLALNVPFFVK